MTWKSINIVALSLSQNHQNTRHLQSSASDRSFCPYAQTQVNAGRHHDDATDFDSSPKFSGCFLRLSIIARKGGAAEQEEAHIASSDSALRVGQIATGARAVLQCSAARRHSCSCPRLSLTQMPGAPHPTPLLLEAPQTNKTTKDAEARAGPNLSNSGSGLFQS